MATATSKLGATQPVTFGMVEEWISSATAIAKHHNVTVEQVLYAHRTLEIARANAMTAEIMEAQ